MMGGSIRLHLVIILLRLSRNKYTLKFYEINFKKTYEETFF